MGFKGITCLVPRSSLDLQRALQLLLGRLIPFEYRTLGKCEFGYTLSNDSKPISFQQYFCNLLFIMIFFEKNQLKTYNFKKYIVDITEYIGYKVITDKANIFISHLFKTMNDVKSVLINALLVLNNIR